jgi:hypothetical protein
MTAFFRLVLITLVLNVTAGFLTANAATLALTSNPGEALAAAKEASRQNPKLSRPDIHPVTLLNWARDAAVMSFYYNYTNLDAWLEEYSHYYTPLGWTHYYRALKSSGNIDRVRSEKITVSATPLEPPKLLWHGVDLSAYKWQVQIPILIQQKLLVTMMLRRTDANTAKDGIAIDQFIAKPY